MSTRGHLPYKVLSWQVGQRCDHLTPHSPLKSNVVHGTTICGPPMAAFSAPPCGRGNKALLTNAVRCLIQPREIEKTGQGNGALHHIEDPITAVLVLRMTPWCKLCVPCPKLAARGCTYLDVLLILTPLQEGIGAPPRSPKMRFTQDVMVMPL